MDNDALRLFGEDRQRFLVLYREFLLNPDIPDEAKIEELCATDNAVYQIGELLRPKNG